MFWSRSSSWEKSSIKAICYFNENLWEAKTYYYNLDEVLAFWLKTLNWHMVPPHLQGNKPSRFYLFASESFIEFPLWVLQSVLKARERRKASFGLPHMQTATLHASGLCGNKNSLSFISSVKNLPLEMKHPVAGFPLKGNCNLFSLVYFLEDKEWKGRGGRKGEGKEQKRGRKRTWRTI